MSPVRVVLMLLVYMVSCAPPFIWLLMGHFGVFGEYADTGSFRTVTFVLIGLVLIMTIFIIPILVLPRILGGAKERGDLLPEGRLAYGMIRRIIRRHGERIEVGGRTFLYIDMEIIVSDEGPEYTATHQALVPETRVEQVREGVRLPLKISPSDRELIVIDWERSTDPDQM